MGKGDKRRPTAIDDHSFQLNWCASFGHKMAATHEVCINCGMTAEEIHGRDQRLVQAFGRRRRRARPAKDAE